VCSDLLGPQQVAFNFLCSSKNTYCDGIAGPIASRLVRYIVLEGLLISPLRNQKNVDLDMRVMRHTPIEK
jgi:hypothetical protein